VPHRRRRSAVVATAIADIPSASPEASFDDDAAASSPFAFTPRDLEHVLRCVELSAGSDGLTQPHPKSGCVLTTAGGTTLIAEAFQMGQGGTRAELLAVEAGPLYKLNPVDPIA
jgi:hypothetical protein